jgi:N-acetylglucosaminyldiphosphoundecaprenol N-acetyl-beta-D-mannosaminyltransferase
VKKTTIFNFPISLGSYKDFVDNIIESASSRKGNYIYVANVHMVIEAFRNRSFLEKAHNASIITPDGKPITIALRMLYGIKQDRVAGMDILPELFSESEKKQIPVYIYGGTENLLEKTNIYLRENYPGLKVCGIFSPPFRELSVEEEETIIDQINNAAPGLIFTVLGCPKQEKWMASMQGKIHATMIGIGGALPVVVGIKKRAPKWIQDASLEWLFRLCQEPIRLFKRYAVTNTMFLFLLGREFIMKKIFHN